VSGCADAPRAGLTQPLSALVSARVSQRIGRDKDRDVDYATSSETPVMFQGVNRARAGDTGLSQKRSSLLKNPSEAH